ncbi:MAG: DegT/DnrJ/EryC1/StrS family aminotransferase [Ardenticatenaceae bacterium]|nr:DegT/DnrJ/EryC1/StrS family aminotransferase [Ardenticatenaceae bacterium]
MPFRNLSGVGLDHLMANGREVLRSGYRHTSAPVEQGVGEGLRDNFIASADESHAIPFVEVKPTPDRPGQGDMAATPDLADNHRSILDFSDYPPRVIVTGTLDYTCAKQKWPPVKLPLIPMSHPDLTEAEIAAVTQVLTTPVLSIGPQLEAFERAAAGGVNSGTRGLHLAGIAAGVRAGDPSGLSPSALALSAVKRRSLVITTPFSFIPSPKLRTGASANCLLSERAIPVFVDVDPATGNLDPTLVAEAVHDLTHARPSAHRWVPAPSTPTPPPRPTCNLQPATCNRCRVRRRPRHRSLRRRHPRPGRAAA